MLDATMIRGVFLAPAIVALLGRWNWWMPRRAARLLRVESPRVATGTETAVQTAERYRGRIEKRRRAGNVPLPTMRACPAAPRHEMRPEYAFARAE